MHRGGAAHAQYRLCARITERLPKILKVFTRSTESTVDRLRALRSANAIQAQLNAKDVLHNHMVMTRLCKHPLSF